MIGKKILLYNPVVRWYVEHGSRLTAVHQFIAYEQGKPF